MPSQFDLTTEAKAEAAATDWFTFKLPYLIGNPEAHYKAGWIDSRNSTKESLEILARALEKIPVQLNELANVLKNGNGPLEAIKNAEHDTCLIAMGFLSRSITKAIAAVKERGDWPLKEDF